MHQVGDSVHSSASTYVLKSGHSAVSLVLNEIADPKEIVDLHGSTPPHTKEADTKTERKRIAALKHVYESIWFVSLRTFIKLVLRTILRTDFVLTLSCPESRGQGDRRRYRIQI